MSPTNRAPWHPTALLLILSLWLATVGNLPLWKALWRLPETHGLQAVITLGSLVLVVLAATVLLLVFTPVFYVVIERLREAMNPTAVEHDAAHFHHAHPVAANEADEDDLAKAAE